MHCQCPQSIRENLEITCSSGKKQNLMANTVLRTVPSLIEKPQMALPTPLIYTIPPRHYIVTCEKTPMPTYTDSHCHLDWFSVPSVSAREAREAGVCRIVIAAATRVLGGCAPATPIGNCPSQPLPARLSGHQGEPNPRAPCACCRQPRPPARRKPQSYPPPERGKLQRFLRLENRMISLNLHTDAASQASLTRHLNRAGIPPLHSAPQGHTR